MAKRSAASSGGEDPNSRLQSELQSLKENDLVREWLIPLFERIGYERVEWYGGVDEEGKDIICWKTDELGDPELGVVQVKRYKPTRRAADDKSFQEVVRQLCQAIEKRLPHSSGVRIAPSSVFFVTPHRIDTKVLSARFERVVELRSRGVKIIDGERLCELLRRHMGSELRRLIGHHDEIGQAIESQLNNVVLFDALHFPMLRHISSFYTDLDFALGKRATRVLFASSLKGTRKTIHLSPEGWGRVVRLSELVRAQLGVELLTRTPEETEKLRAATEAARKEVEQEVESLRGKMQDESEREEKARRAYATERAKLVAESPSVLDLEDKFLELHRTLATQSEETKEDIRHRDDLRRQLEIVEGQLEKGAGKMLRYWRTEIAAATRKETYRVELAKKRVAGAGSTYEVEIDGVRIAKELRSRRAAILDAIKRYNKRTPRPSTIRRFLAKCQPLFTLCGQLRDSAEVARCIELRGATPRGSTPKTRLTIPIHGLFDAGVDLLVLGEAGSGKTTSLQMYAQRTIEREPDGRCCLFVPAARLISSWKGASKTVQGGGTLGRFEEGLSAFLASLGTAVSPEQLCRELQSRKGVVLLDGLDEAGNRATELVQSAREFTRRVGPLQLIMSSRTGPSISERVEDLGVTLLPFTPRQRASFIRDWFGEQPERGRRVLSHLRDNRELGEVVRNPLLATILCVLAEHDVPLPDSEVRLYEERMRLLTGNYDFHKGVSRQRTHPRDLQSVAQKVAFRMHATLLREAPMADLIGMARSGAAARLGGESCETAVGELFDPCNILVPMTDEGTVGFGHFRYQEYLVAREILENRSVSVLSIIDDAWWAGALVMLARMSDDLSWLMDRVVTAQKVAASSEVLLAMAKAGPPADRDKHVSLIEHSLQRERRDAAKAPYDPELGGYKDDDVDLGQYVGGLSEELLEVELADLYEDSTFEDDDWG